MLTKTDEKEVQKYFFFDNAYRNNYLPHVSTRSH